MNDETKDDIMKRTREWLQSCVNAATRSGVPEEADLEAFILAHIDGEQARQDAAVAAAREEQREADAKFCPNCLGVGFVERPVPCPYCDDSTHDHYCPTGTQRQQCGCGAERIRGTPLDATPLADELRTLRARVSELEAHVADLEGAVNRSSESWHSQPSPSGAGGCTSSGFKTNAGAGERAMNDDVKKAVEWLRKLRDDARAVWGAKHPTRSQRFLDLSPDEAESVVGWLDGEEARTKAAVEAERARIAALVRKVSTRLYEHNDELNFEEVATLANAIEKGARHE